MLKRTALGLLLSLFATFASAQAPQFAAGQVFGNSTASQRNGRPENITSIFDRAFASTSGMLPSSRGGNSANLSGCTGGALFTTGLAACLGTTGTGNFIRATVVRTKATADFTLYIRSDGSNVLCSGLVDAAVGAAPNCAMQTPQGAVDLLWNSYDGGGFNCTIQFSGGLPATYAGFSREGTPVGCIPTFSGNVASASNYNVTSNNPSVATIDVRRGFRAYFKGFRVTTTGTVGRGMHLSGTGSFVLQSGNMEWCGAPDGMISIDHQAAFGDDNNTSTVCGNGAFYTAARSGGHVTSGGAVTNTGTPTLTQGYYVATNNGVNQSNQTFSGAAAGPSGYSDNGGVITTVNVPSGTTEAQVWTGGLNNGRGAWTIIKQSPVAIQAGGATCGVTTEITLVTITLPANAIGANGTLRVTTTWSMTNNANTKAGRVRLGGIGGTAFMSSALTSALGLKTMIDISNRNSASSQFSLTVPVAQGGWGTTPGGLTTGAINTANAQDLLITAQCTTSAADNITLESYIVELAYAQ